MEGKPGVATQTTQTEANLGEGVPEIVLGQTKEV